MDRYPYLEYTILLDESILTRLGRLHYLLHITRKQNHVNAYQVFGAVAGEGAREGGGGGGGGGGWGW